MKKRIIVLVIAILLTAFYNLGCDPNQAVSDDDPESIEALCIEEGGAVETRLCCKATGDFPNTCLIGACGCSPDYSHEVKVCVCGEGECWDETGCVEEPGL